MGRAAHPPFSLDLALIVALGFGACMPPEVEVGRDATLQEEAGTGGEPARGGSLGNAGDSSTDAGGEPSVPNGGITSAGGSMTLPASNGGVAGVTRSMTAGRAGLGGAAPGVAGSGGASMSIAGTGVVSSGGTGGSSTTTGFICPEEGTQDEVLWTLEMFCDTFTCPSSVDGAKDYLSRQFQGCPTVRNEVRAGCGLSQVSVQTEKESDAYVYTEGAEELVGATIHNDMPWGPCNVHRYLAGVMARGCETATSCPFCGPMATCP